MFKTILYGAGTALLSFFVSGVVAVQFTPYVAEIAIAGGIAGGAIGAYKGHQADKRASEEKAPEHKSAREERLKKLTN